MRVILLGLIVVLMLRRLLGLSVPLMLKRCLDMNIVLMLKQWCLMELCYVMDLGGPATQKGTLHPPTFGGCPNPGEGAAAAAGGDVAAVSR